MDLTFHARRESTQNATFADRCSRPISLARRAATPTAAIRNLDQAIAYLEQRGPVTYVGLSSSECEEVKSWKTSLSHARREFTIAEQAASPLERSVALVRAEQLLSQPAPKGVEFYPNVGSRDAGIVRVMLEFVLFVGLFVFCCIL